jgi:hypothetical protein
MPRLDDTAVAEGLQHLPGWERRGNQIVKTFTRADFGLAMVFVNEVAYPARLSDRRTRRCHGWRGGPGGSSPAGSRAWAPPRHRVVIGHSHRSPTGW